MTQSVIMLVGIPASGKSTWAERHLELDSGRVDYISTDAIREERFGDVGDMSNNRKVFAIMKDTLRRSLESGQDVILDATFATAGERSPYVRLAKGYGASVTAYFFKTDLSVALKRNAARDRKVPTWAISKRHSVLDEPTKEEGFDRVVVIDNTVH